MSAIVYKLLEGDPWQVTEIKLLDREIKRQCLLLKKFKPIPYDKITIFDGEKSIKAAAILFANGSTWNAALSKFV